MKVSIKNLAVDMEVKTKGVELDVYDSAGKHLGDLVVTKTGLIWCQGRVNRANGVKITWDAFIKAYSPAPKVAKGSKTGKKVKSTPAVVPAAKKTRRVGKSVAQPAPSASPTSTTP